MARKYSLLNVDFPAFTCKIKGKKHYYALVPDRTDSNYELSDQYIRYISNPRAKFKKILHLVYDAQDYHHSSRMAVSNGQLLIAAYEPQEIIQQVRTRFNRKYRILKKVSNESTVHSVRFYTETGITWAAAKQLVNWAGKHLLDVTFSKVDFSVKYTDGTLTVEREFTYKEYEKAGYFIDEAYKLLLFHADMLPTKSV